MRRGAARAWVLIGSMGLAGCSAGSQAPEAAPPATVQTTSTGPIPDDGTASAAPPGDDAATSDTPVADGPLEITIAAIGDILAHSRVNVTANRLAGGVPDVYDYRPMFADVAPLISSADLALCHMETPLSPDNTGISVPDTLTFNTPHEMAQALADAGVDGCDFASNHTMDRGIEGVRATEEVLRAAGLGYAGPTAHEDRAGVAEVYEVPTAAGDEATVAHLAYTYTYPNDGSPTTFIPGEALWLEASSWPVIGSQGILDQATAAREAGADFVVVSMHWGQEYQSTPTADQTEIARDLLASDVVDLILGTHVHVVQPCEQINGKQVIYGLGNFLSNQSPDTNVTLTPPTQEGMIATFTLRRDAEGVVTTEMDYQPTRVEITPWEVETGPHVVRLVSPQTYAETWERTTSTVDSLGGCGATAVHP